MDGCVSSAIPIASSCVSPRPSTRAAAAALPGIGAPDIEPEVVAGGTAVPGAGAGVVAAGAGAVVAGGGDAGVVGAGVGVCARAGTALASRHSTSATET